MKRTSILLMALMLCTVASFGQKKPKLSKAESNFKSGEFAEALAIITAAESYEKTMDDPKTYYLKGLVHAAIDTSGSDLVENARDIAVAAFAKYEELEDPGKEETLISDMGIFTYTQLIDTYFGFYFNEGANAYSSEDYPTAVEAFANAAQIKPEDTTAYIYGGYAASNAGDQQTAKMNYEKAIEIGINSKDPYNLLTYIYGTVDKDKEKALEMTRTAIEKFPNDNDFKRNEIQLLIELEKIDEARGNLEKAIEAEPDDPALRFSLGVMYDNLAETREDPEAKEADQQKALESYKSATEVDPEYINAYYNIGVMMISRANEIIKTINNLGVSKADMKKADELTPLMNERLEAALPSWEKVNELEPNNRKTLETLQYLYAQLRMMDKAEAIMNQIDALPAEGN